jgi:dihydrodipicolinate synthase/N-acetylneuraminate lyase
MRQQPTILGTVCVSWTERFDFDEGLFRRVVRDLIEKGLKDLYIFGTAGEGHAAFIGVVRTKLSQGMTA